MTKRIVSGIFILTALGALGVILAGALTSGEQLIVRFLTAVIVAALGLYVISDLRLQADDDAVVARSSGSGRASAALEAPPNSTAAFMATVTKRGESKTAAESETEHLDEHRAADEELVPIESAMAEVDADDRFYQADTTLDLTAPRSELASVAAGPEGLPTLDDPFLTANGDGDLGSEPPSSLVDLDYDSDALASTEIDDDQSAYVFSGGDAELFSMDTTEVSLRELAPQDTGPQEDDPALDRFGIGIHDLVDEPTDDLVTSQLPAIGDNFGLTVDEALGVDEAFDHDSQTTNGPTSDDDRASAGETAPVSGLTDANLEFVNAELADAEFVGIGFSASEDVDAESGGADYVDAEAADHEWPTPAAHLNPPTELHPSGPSEERSALDHDGNETAVAHRSANGFSQLPIASRGANSELQAADYADAPLAPIIDLREVHSFQAAGSIDVAIKAGEVEVVTTLIEQGMLSTEGPISDRDVRTMVYVAFTSNELRKLLMAGGSPDGPNQDLDLGPVELFDERVHMPAPKTLYTGLPKARSQLG